MPMNMTPSNASTMVRLWFSHTFFTPLFLPR
jgi:hypothetical protein